MVPFIQYKIYLRLMSPHVPNSTVLDLRDAFFIVPLHYLSQLLLFSLGRP